MTSLSNSRHKTEWNKILILVGAGIVAAFQIGKVPPIVPELMETLKFNLFIASWIISSFNILGILLSPIAGSIADRMNVKAIMIIGLCCLGFGSLIGSFATGYKILIITRLIEGAGYIFLIVSVPSVLFKLTAPKDLRFVFGIWGSFMPMGAAIMMVLSPILTHHIGWDGLWQINALITLLYIIPLTMLMNTLDIQKQQASISIRNIANDIHLVIKAITPALLALSFMIYAMMFLSILGFLPTMLINDSHMSSTTAAFFSGIALLMNAPGNWLGGFFLKRGTKRWQLLFIAQFSMGIISFAVYSTALPISIRLSAVMLLMGIGGIIPATVLEGASATAPHKRLVGTSNGLLMQGAQIGLLMGPPLLAVLISQTGSWQIAPYFIMSIATIGMILAVFIKILQK